MAVYHVHVPILEFFLETFDRCDEDGTLEVHGIPDNLKHLKCPYIMCRCSSRNFLKRFYPCDTEGTLEVHGIPDKLKSLIRL